MSKDGVLVPVVQTQKYHFNEKMERREFCSLMAELDQQMKDLCIDLRVMYCQAQKGCASVEEANTHWDTFTKSPLVSDLGPDKKLLNLHYDLSRYSPQEIIVVLDKDKLWVHACRDKKGKEKAREFHQAFPVSKSVKPDQIQPTLSKDGVLVIKVPLVKPERLDAARKAAPISSGTEAEYETKMSTVNSMHATSTESSIAQNN